MLDESPCIYLRIIVYLYIIYIYPSNNCNNNNNIHRPLLLLPPEDPPLHKRKTTCVPYYTQLPNACIYNYTRITISLRLCRGFLFFLDGVVEAAVLWGKGYIFLRSVVRDYVVSGGERREIK